MSSAYPTAADNPTNLVDGTDFEEAVNINNAYDFIKAIQAFVGVNGKGQSWTTDFLEFLANQFSPPVVSKVSASSLSVSAGPIVVKNSGQSNRLLRHNTSPVTVTSANLTTGAMAVGFYYLFAVGDSAAGTFTVKFDVSPTAPTGLTNFFLIGWFYNETAGVLDVTTGMVGNTKRPGVRNILIINDTTDTSVTGDTNYHNGAPTIHFYSPSQVIDIKAMIQLYQGSVNEYGMFCWSVDGTDQTAYAGVIKDTSGAGSAAAWNMPVDWKGAIAAVTTTLIPRLKANSAGYTTHMFNKVITIEEP